MKKKSTTTPWPYVCRRRSNNIWRHRGLRPLVHQRDSCSSAAIIENKTLRFNLKMQKRNRLFTNKASHTNWLTQRHRLLSLPPPVHLLPFKLLVPVNLPKSVFTAQSIFDY
ncbi:uncharacterized protein LOC111054942 isoform X2 [Nilaparvata lugens]|uniref:uncharacterized protein LOC111054942 isoform X2 n=1 Tax=Nilaparvata lugens TaxID=108931 RepID=UPI000B99052A|nr:uncharacterized protein LOC111054942 isoform X2 [Nilaparvata lugens]